MNARHDPAPLDLPLPPESRDSRRRQVGEIELRDAAVQKFNQLLAQIAPNAPRVDLDARKIGVQIVDVRVKRVDFPASTVESIYNRMRTEREREAREHRSQGTEMSDRIKSEADRQQRVILAEAYRQSEILRGQGDAEAAAIARKAFGQDAEFYRFYRSLQAYRQTFNKPSDVMVLKGDNEFLRYMKQK